MNMDDVKEIIRTIKGAKLPVLIFLSLVILPLILPKWNELFPPSWKFPINIIIVIIWIIALFIQWISDRNERKDWRTKTILANYLKKYKQRSISFLSTEWEAKKDFPVKHIKHLLSKYPDELKSVQMAKGKGQGVGLVSNTTDKEIEEEK